MPASFFDGHQLSDPDKQAKATALLRAQKNARKRNKGEHEGEIVIPLNVKITAGMTFMMQGFGPEWDSKWIVVEAKHTIGGRGSETALSVRKCLPY
jgi:hypothetical protein